MAETLTNADLAVGTVPCLIVLHAFADCAEAE